jgi:hypothetical protein
MSYTVVQTKTAVSSVAGTAFSCTFDSAPTGGNMLMAALWHSGTTLLPLDSSGTSWNMGALNAQQSVCTVYIWVALAAPGLQTWSATHTGSVTWAVVIREYADITYPVDLDNGAAYNDAAGASTYQMGVVNTDGSDALAVAVCGQQGTARTATSWSDSFTEVADLQPSGSPVGALGVAEKVLTGPGAQETWVTLSGTTSSIVSSMLTAVNGSSMASLSRSRQQSAQQSGW